MICTRKNQGRGTSKKSAGAGRGGFSLVEVLIAVVVVGVGISAAVYGLGSGQKSAHEGRSDLVAANLACWLKQYSEGLAFRDPDGGGIFGPEAGETEFSDFDDIDDLNGLTLMPPVGADGATLSSYGIWTQNVSVVSLDPETFEELVVSGDSPLVKVEVEILCQGAFKDEYQWVVTER